MTNEKEDNGIGKDKSLDLRVCIRNISEQKESSKPGSNLDLIDHIGWTVKDINAFGSWEIGSEVIRKPSKTEAGQVRKN